jgi:hypothetical protein
MAKCNECDGHCCKYITVQIDEPKDDIDFEELKWFLCHENILVYIDHDGQWCLEVKTHCKFQDQKTNLCTIYETRPKVCQEHLEEECEGNHEYEEHYQKVFHTIGEVDEYRKELQSSKSPQSVQSSNIKEAQESV